MATDEVLPTKQRPKEMPKGDLVWMLLGIVLGSFTAGASLVLAINAISRHGLKSEGFMLFLVMTCVSLCGVAVRSAIIISRAKWIPERGY